MKEQKKYYIYGIATIFAILIISLTIYNTRTIKYEGKINCDTGIIGLIYDGYWDNQPYKDNITISAECNERGCINTQIEITKYHRELLSKTIKLDKIQNINCNMDFKGEIPLNILYNLY